MIGSKSRISVVLALLATVLMAALIVGIPRASALTSFDLTGSNLGGGFAGPFVNVQYSLSGQTATFTFTSLSDGEYLYLLGDGSSAALVLNTDSATLGAISGTNLAGFGPTTYTYADPPGTSQVDGWGRFNLTIDSNDGFTSSSNSITFSVTNTGTPWLTEADVLEANADGNFAAAHVFACDINPDPTCTTSDGAALTGFASEGGGDGGGGGATPIPEPSTLLLLGSGLLFLNKVTRRFTRKHD